MGALSSVRARLSGRSQIDQLAETVAELTRVANTAAAQAESALRIAEAAHHAVADADPRQSLEIVTATRDEVRRLTVDLTEQLNALSNDLRAQG